MAVGAFVRRLLVLSSSSAVSSSWTASLVAPSRVQRPASSVQRPRRVLVTAPFKSQSPVAYALSQPAMRAYGEHAPTPAERVFFLNASAVFAWAVRLMTLAEDVNGAAAKQRRPSTATEAGRRSRGEGPAKVKATGTEVKATRTEANAVSTASKQRGEERRTFKGAEVHAGDEVEDDARPKKHETGRRKRRRTEGGSRHKAEPNHGLTPAEASARQRSAGLVTHGPVATMSSKLRLFFSDLLLDNTGRYATIPGRA